MDFPLALACLSQATYALSGVFFFLGPPGGIEG
jgi:hypothetical protein